MVGSGEAIGELVSGAMVVGCGVVQAAIVIDKIANPMHSVKDRFGLGIYRSRQ